MPDFSRTLCVLAHPDDEALGCGGLLSLLSASSFISRVVIVCSSVDKRDTPFDVSDTHSHFYEALEVLGVDSSSLLDFPNLCLNTLPQYQLVQAVESEILDFMPTAIITHDISDLNIDHQCLSRAVVVASRVYHRKSINKNSPSVLTCEIPSSTEWNLGLPTFVPNFFVPFSEHYLTCKINACFKYPDVMRSCPHPRSTSYIQSLARMRGSQSNCNFAEAFNILFDTFTL